MAVAVQDLYAPQNRCFGCGPANEKGLRLKSFTVHENSDELVAHFQPEAHHQAYGGILNGGIIGALLDCHSNWTAAIALMRASGLTAPPCTVTSEFSVKLKRPTPLDTLIEVRARPIERGVDRATIEATLSVEGIVSATCRGIFVAVKPGHPAFHRW